MKLTDATIWYELTSPGYPDTYPENIECEWFLEVPEDHVVDFMFEEYNTTSTSCGDRVRLLHAGNGYTFLRVSC